MKLEKPQTKIKPTFKLADDFFDLKKINTNVIIEQLEENIKLREMPVEVQVKKRLKLD